MTDGGFRDTYTIRTDIRTDVFSLMVQNPTVTDEDDDWGGWTTYTIRSGCRMGGLPGPIRVRHPSTVRTDVFLLNLNSKQLQEFSQHNQTWGHRTSTFVS